MKVYLFLLYCILSISTFAQVGIGVDNLESGAILHLEDETKGLIIPRVSLTGIDDIATIIPNPTEGLLVYNTNNTLPSSLAVNEGFYFWDGSIWKRLYAEGYSEHFQQTTTVTAANQTTIYPIPNLNKTLSLPYTGTYQVAISAYYAVAPKIASNSSDAAGYAEIFLEIDGIKVASNFVTSSSKQTESARFNDLAQQVFFVYTENFTQGDHTFIVKAQELKKRNTSGSSFFGIGTAGYTGNVGNDGINNNEDDDDNAQKATMTITLLRQF